MEMIVFLLPFTVLRQYAGGIHLEKAGGCMAVSGILVLLCSLYLASAPAVIWQMRIIWFVAVGVIFIMAPVDASSKKLDAKEKKVYGMRARVILVIECAIAGVFSVIGYSLIVNGIMVAHIYIRFLHDPFFPSRKLDWTYRYFSLHLFRPLIISRRTASCKRQAEQGYFLFVDIFCIFYQFQIHFYIPLVSCSFCSVYHPFAIRFSQVFLIPIMD